MAELGFMGDRLVVQVEEEELKHINEDVERVMFAWDYRISEVFEKRGAEDELV